MKPTLVLIVSTSYVSAHISGKGEVLRLPVPITSGSTDDMRRVVLHVYHDLIRQMRMNNVGGDIGGVYERVHILYTAPWTRIELHESFHERQRDFPVTEESINILVNACFDQTMRRFTPELDMTQKMIGQDKEKTWHGMRAEVASVKLNGYRVENYLGRITQRLDVITAVTLVDTELHRVCMREALMAFHTDNIEGRAYSMVVGDYINSKNNKENKAKDAQNKKKEENQNQKDYVYKNQSNNQKINQDQNIMIACYGGEAVEYIIYDQGVLCQNSIYADGYYPMIRCIAEKLDMSVNTAMSYMNMHHKNVLGEQMVMRLEKSMHHYHDISTKIWYEVMGDTQKSGKAPTSMIAVGEHVVVEALIPREDDAALMGGIVIADTHNNNVDIINYMIQ